jgi:hypothetical protein
MNLIRCIIVYFLWYVYGGIIIIPWIQSRWGARYSLPVQTGRGAHPASYTVGTGSFPGVKRPGRGVDHPPQSSTEVRESRAITSAPPIGLRGLLQGELYLYSIIIIIIIIIKCNWVFIWSLH